ncbi:MAG: AMP-binding protein [Pseudomonadota bacterium]|nr:AMP-binding protein [Pseudomonadota bacterium]MBU2226186.1 AMP-binding protein [Pseudomonadota bacterium]
MDFVQFLRGQVRRYGSKTLIFSDEGSISYQEFDDITDRMAYGLEMMGITGGDHVAVLHPNSSQCLLSYIAIIKAGGIVVPINYIYTAREVKYLLNNSKSKAIIAHEAISSLIEEIRDETPNLNHIIVRKGTDTVEVEITDRVGTTLLPIKERSFNPEDPAMMFYTSGTIGNPKGVVLTHRCLYFGGPNIAQNYGLKDEDITIAVLPMSHVFAIASPFLGSLSSGGSIVVVDRFKPQIIFEMIEKYSVTWFPGVPTMFIYLLNSLPENTHDLSSLRMGLSGGASLPIEVLKRWEEAFKAEIIEVYGLTESTGLVTANPVYGIRKSGSVGINVSGVTVKVVDKDGKELPDGEVGNLIFKGPNATKCYFNLPKETEEKIRNGWIYTGDHAYRDEDGYFFIVGREKELIISGGYNIYPKEIEEILHTHPAVSEVAVIGISDQVKGEVPKAFVCLKEGITITKERLLEHCKKNLAPYKMPIIEFMKELPKNTTGKIMKKELPRE